MPMAKNKPMGTKEAAKKARSKASGKVEIDTIKKVGFVKSLVQKPSDKKYSRKAKVLDAVTGELKPTKYKKFYARGPVMVTKASVKRVDSDAYNLLAKRAKAAGLKGQDAKIAISKSLNAISRQMETDRGRSATRAEGIAKREQKKRRNTDLTR
jgi:NAD(P)H-flavin reductase